MSGSLAGLRVGYERVKAACGEAYASSATGDEIGLLVHRSLTFLEESCSVTDLTSRVPGKSYFGFRRRRAATVISRPVNREYFLFDPARVDRLWNARNLSRLSNEERSQLL